MPYVTVDLETATHHGHDVDLEVESAPPAVFEVKDLSVYYGSFRAVRDV